MPDDEVTALTTARPHQAGGHLHPAGQQSTAMTATPERHRRPVSQLSARDLDLYGNQLARCLKALSTDAPSAPMSSANWPRYRPNSNHVPEPAQAQQPCRPRDVSGLTVSELERTRRELTANLALVRSDSPARVPILAHIGAIDTELAGRTGQGWQPQAPSAEVRPGMGNPAARVNPGELGTEPGVVSSCWP